MAQVALIEKAVFVDRALNCRPIAVTGKPRVRPYTERTRVIRDRGLRQAKLPRDRSLGEAIGE